MISARRTVGCPRPSTVTVRSGRSGLTVEHVDAVAPDVLAALPLICCST